MKSALRERLRSGKVDPATGAMDGADQLPELVEYVVRRLSDLRKARDAAFEAKMKKYMAVWARNFRHRAQHRLGPDGVPIDVPEDDVFRRLNHSLQLVSSVMRFLLSRVYKDLFGSRPWLSATPQGPQDVAEASEIQKHGEYKLNEAEWQEKSRGVLETALALGFCAVKTTWSEQWDVSERLQPILFSPQDGQPVVTQKGEYVSPEDDTQEAGEGAQPPSEEDGEQAGAPTVPRVFSKDPSIPVPDETNGLHFKPHLIEDKERRYCGLDYSPLHWKDVVWPINAAELDLGRGDCDFIGVTRDMTLEEMRLAYDPDGTNADIQDLLDAMASGPMAPQSEAGKPNEERGEPIVNASDPKNPVFKITECFFRRRVLEKGPESRIFLVLVESLQKAAWVEYLAASSPRAQAPVHLVAVNRVPGRAYGIGLFETFEMASDALDRLINCIMLRNEEHANPDRFIDARLQNELDGGKIKKGVGIRQPVENKTGGPLANLIHTDILPDLDERTWKLVELFMQLIQVETGVTNASQGDMTDLPSNSTATGINSMLESSSVLHQFVLGEIRDGLTPPLRYAIELTYFSQDCDEAYEYLEGDSAALQQVAQAQAVLAAGDPAQAEGDPAQAEGDPAQAEGDPAGAPAPAAPALQPGVMTYAQARALANIPMKVQILLSRAKRQEMREAIFQAIPQAATFYQYPPQIQKRVLKLFTDGFQTLGLDNPGQYFPTPQEIDAALQAQQQNAGHDPQERISLRENMDYDKVPPSIQRQMEADAGFTPASDAEAAAFNASRQKPAAESPSKAAPADPNEAAEPGEPALPPAPAHPHPVTQAA